jgi:hypothetical protein
MLRAAGGWYEEDECWAIVAITFPHLFTALERRYAEQTIKDSWPDAWEAIFGTILAAGRIPHEGPAGLRGRARRRLDRRFSDHLGAAEGLRRVRRDARWQARRRHRGTPLPRPGREYEIGRFGFVIDPDRHAVYAGPSSFVGWQGRGSP